MKMLFTILIVSFVCMPILGSLQSVEARGGDHKGALNNNLEGPYTLYPDDIMSPNGKPYNP